jgi:hypothetical protein
MAIPLGAESESFVASLLTKETTAFREKRHKKTRTH